jgi:hypothetical protein
VLVLRSLISNGFTPDQRRTGFLPNPIPFPASVLPYLDGSVRHHFISGGFDMGRTLGALAFLALAIAAPVQQAAAQEPNPLGGALLGGAAGAIIGGVAGGGKGAAIGALVGAGTGAIIASQGQPRPGGYRYYQNGCYQQRPDGAWVVVAPQYCGGPAPAPVAVVAPPPPPVDPLRDRMLELRGGCEAGDRGACVRLGIIIGENRARRTAWRREYPDVFFYER